MTKTEAKERIEKLKREVERHRYLYHVLDRVEISDAALDSLKHELYQLEQQYPELITRDSPTQRVGGEPLPEFKKIRHFEPMLSMEDVFSFEEFGDWHKRNKKLIPSLGEDFYAEIKMDGLAVSLVYENGIFTTGSTRGDGRIGEDVTNNLKTIESIPLALRSPSEKEIADFIKSAPGMDEKKFRELVTAHRGRIEIRGEAFMRKKVFNELNSAAKKLGEPLFANPRNAAAGAIRQLDSKITASRHLSFYGYALATDFGEATHEEAHKIIKMLGAPVNPLVARCSSLADAQNFHEKVKKERERLDYWTDGIVVVVNGNKNFNRLGVVGKTPRGHIAYKFPAEQVATVVLDVVWGVGRMGTVTPVARVRPVFVAGTTVTNATLHNLDEIGRLGVKIGDTVILEKAGDVIPKIVRVLPNLRTGHEKSVHPPKHCPICGTELLRREGEVAIICPNKNCFARNSAGIKHFVARNAMNIEGLGEKTIEQFLNEGVIRDASDLYDLKAGDILPLERFAETSADNIVNAVAMSREAPFARFLYALGIENIGEETARLLAERFGSVSRLRNAKLEELTAVPGIGEIIAKSVHSWFMDPAHSSYLGRLLKKIKVTATPHKAAGPFSEKTFVFTGELNKMSRDEAKERVRDLGGKASESVSKKTDYVVAGPGAGEKLDKARKLNVRVLNENEFLAMINK
jgi:DNA ligase (NAD+)